MVSSKSELLPRHRDSLRNPYENNGHLITTGDMVAKSKKARLSNDLIRLHGAHNTDTIQKMVQRVDNKGIANLKEEDYGKFLHEFNQ